MVLRPGIYRSAAGAPTLTTRYHQYHRKSDQVFSSMFRNITLPACRFRSARSVARFTHSDGPR